MPNRTSQRGKLDTPTARTPISKRHTLSSHFVIGEEKAESWLRGLYLACGKLANFPGPFAYPIDEIATEKLGQQVRRMIYRGPQNERPIGAPYRVYFYTVGDEAIFVIRVLHGAAGPWPAPE